QAARMNDAKFLFSRFDAQPAFRFGACHTGPVLHDVIMLFQGAGARVEIEADGAKSLARVAMRPKLRAYGLAAVEQAEMFGVLDKLSKRQDDADGIAEATDAGGFGDAELDLFVLAQGGLGQQERQ